MISCIKYVGAVNLRDLQLYAVLYAGRQGFLAQLDVPTARLQNLLNVHQQELQNLQHSILYCSRLQGLDQRKRKNDSLALHLMKATVLAESYNIFIVICLLTVAR